MSKKHSRRNVIAIAVYRLEDWKRLLDISDDEEELEDTWFEWNENLNKVEDKLRKQGIKYKEIVIDLDELIKYCKRKDVKIDANSRAKFTARKLQEPYQEG